MEQEKDSKDDVFFEDIVKKTKTGITFPKSLREELFEEDQEVFFKLIVPQEKDKIILKILSQEQAKLLLEKVKSQKPKLSRPKQQEKGDSVTKALSLAPSWGEYFIYDFEAKEKVQPILESAFYKFAEKPPYLEDAMGRVKYTLISFLSSTKTENAKLYLSVVKFLIDVIEKFDLPNLIEWIYEKIVPNIESKFLYELSLLELVEISLKTKRFQKSEIFIKEIMTNIDGYPRSELYNIMNSFKQLIKKIRDVELSENVSNYMKDKLIEYENSFEDIDYKLQMIELLEELKFIEVAYNLAKDIQIKLPPESIKIEEVRRLLRRLKEKPIS